MENILKIVKREGIPLKKRDDTYQYTCLSCGGAAKIYPLTNRFCCTKCNVKGGGLRFIMNLKKMNIFEGWDYLKNGMDAMGPKKIKKNKSG